MLDLDQLIPADHLARAIDHLGEAAAWCEIPGGQQKRRGLRGAAWADPQMLVAMWVCAEHRRYQAPRRASEAKLYFDRMTYYVLPVTKPPLFGRGS